MKNWTSGQIIASGLFLISAVMAILVFWIARNDHDMKLLALGAVLGFISGSSGTASAILTGRDMMKPHDPGDLPAGSVVEESSKVQTPPITGA